MAGTTSALVRELRWYDAPEGGFGSASLTQAYGALFLTPGKRLDLYESLIHESSHLELTARMALDKLLVDGAVRAPSPFRDAKRPLSRVLHATFVCARLIHGYERCRTLVTPDEQRLANERGARLRDDLAKGIVTLAEHAEWTQLGSRLFSQLAAAFDIAAIASGPRG
jgi:HEXXH motif-containing protein